MMTAVGLSDAGIADVRDNRKMACGTMYISSSEDQRQSLSKEYLDQIKNTMIRHEELFKEQVKALHKLYNVQKSFMQEVKKMIWCSAQPLASSSNNKDACCYQVNDSVVEGKPLVDAYISAMDHTEESCVIPMNPLSAVKEFTGSSSERSFCSEIRDIKVSPSACNKQRKIFDLERPPEEYMDESDYQIESNNFDILGANTCLLQGNQNIVEDSLMRCKPDALQVGYLNLKRRDRRPESSKRSERSQEFHDFNKASESEIHTAFAKCTTVIQSLQDTFRHNILQDLPWDHLPAVGLSTTNPSLDSHVEKLPWLLQQAAPLSTQRLNCACKSDFFESEELHREGKDTEKVKVKLPRNADLMDSTHLHLALESNNKIIVPHLELEQQLQQDLDECVPSHGGLLTTNTADCPQSSSNHCIQGVSEPSPLARDLNSCSGVLTYQTGDDDGNGNPNHSGHGSNSPLYRCEKKFGDKDLSIFTSNNSKCDSDCELVQTGQAKEEVMKSELKEAPRSTNDEIKTSLSSSIPGSDGKQRHAGELECAVSCSESEKSRGEPVVVKESKEVKSESTLEEACESIAAKILLSFAPCKSKSDSKWQYCETQIDVESSRSSRESMGHVKKQNRRARSALNYGNGVGMDEAIKWTKSVSGRRRRTSRRQQ